MRTKFGEHIFCFSEPAIQNSLLSNLHIVIYSNMMKKTAQECTFRSLS